MSIWQKKRHGDDVKCGGYGQCPDCTDLHESSIINDLNWLALNSKTYVIYHKMCMDGFGGAYSAWKKLGDSAIYIPYQYGEAIPEIADNSIVYLIDVSFSREELEAINKRVQKLVVLDHHESAMDNLKGLNYCIFDMKKSGAMLAWEYFHPKVKVPFYIKYIQDRDLFTNKLKDTHEIHLGIYSLPLNFIEWDKKIGHKISLKKNGEAIVSFQNKLIKEVESHIVFVNFEGYRNIPCVNSVVLTSDIGAELNKKIENAPFCLIYLINAKGRVKWSIRSNKDDFNGIPIAEKHGGGGHKKACGFTTDLLFLNNLLNNKE